MRRMVGLRGMLALGVTLGIEGIGLTANAQSSARAARTEQPATKPVQVPSPVTAKATLNAQTSTPEALSQPQLVRPAGQAEGDSAAQSAAASPAVLDALIPVSTAGGLTSNQVAGRALATSYNAAAQNEALKVAQTRVDEALIAYFPRLTATASYTRLSPLTPPAIMVENNQSFSFPVFLDNYLLQAGLVVPLTDYVLRLSQSYASASRSAKAAALNEKAARLSSALDGRVAYFTWLRASAQVTVAERNLQVTKAHLVDANHGFQVGTASRADVLSAEAQVARAELVVEQERLAAAAAEDRIRIAMHDASGKHYVVGEDLRSAGSERENAAESLESLRAEALENRLDIRALDETAWSLQEEAKAAKAGLYPRIEGFGDVIYANPNQRVFPQEAKFRATWDVGIRLTWSPNDTFIAQSTKENARARANQTQMQKAALMDTVRTEVLQAYQAVAQSKVAVETTSRAYAAAEESYRVRRELFRNGRATSVELQDAEVALFRAGFESVNAHADLRIAQARLRHAVGRDTPDLAQR